MEALDLAQNSVYLVALPIALGLLAAGTGVPGLLFGAELDPGDGSTVAANAATPTFKLSATGETGSELNVGVTPDGGVYVGGWGDIARSLDWGDSWTHHPIQHVPALGFAADRVLVTDHDTGRVFVSDTYLGCTFLSWSDDQAHSWDSNRVACGGGATDHQKVAVGKRVSPLMDPTGGTLYENLIYVCANGLAATNCGVSADGGLTFLPTNQHSVGCAFQGAPVVGANGWLYEPAGCGTGQVRRTANAGYTWTVFSTGLPKSGDTPDMAVTPDGTQYFFYSTPDWKPAIARSTDGGFTWEGPFFVDLPGVTSAVFPSIVSGDDGRIALSFYATTDDPAGWNKNPGDAPNGVRWHGYVAIVTDADAVTPTLTPVQVTPTGDPLQYGGLSKLGGGLHNIADYMDIDVAPDGRVVAVFTDGCPATCTGRGASDQDDAIVALQLTGPRLFA